MLIRAQADPRVLVLASCRDVGRERRRLADDEARFGQNSLEALLRGERRRWPLYLEVIGVSLEQRRIGGDSRVRLCSPLRSRN